MKTSGILLPIFSLPSDYGIGCFSKEAYKFVDFLEEAGQKYWQILPLGTIGAGNSPYLSFSSFAGSAYYIDLEQLLEEGLLKKKELESIKEENKGKVDYEKIREDHRKLLRKAYFRFHPDEDYKKFIKDNEYWIGEYAEYMSEKKSKFPESYFCFCQYYFHKQWLALKKYANDKGIQIVGDLPFYVALDGTAFTYHKELFKVDEEGKATVVGGCPPDAFAEDVGSVKVESIAAIVSMLCSLSPGGVSPICLYCSAISASSRKRACSASGAPPFVCSSGCVEEGLVSFGWGEVLDWSCSSGWFINAAS